MYSGAGLNSNNAKIRDRARRERCPPLNSDKDCFHTLPNATRTSSPSKKSQPSGGSSFAIVPGNRVEKIDPKSLQPKFFLVNKMQDRIPCFTNKLLLMAKLYLKIHTLAFSLSPMSLSDSLSSFHQVLELLCGFLFVILFQITQV
jgi:hypothetical protein